jgi:response regulator RpfG family c-di-GMP phosphodiesterase
VSAPKILFIDDEPRVLSALKRVLFGRFDIDITTQPDAALRLLRDRGPYAIVVSDMRMPNVDGLQFLAQAQRISPDTVRIMLTGDAEQSTAARAVNEVSVFRFLTKPCSADDLAVALQAGLDHHLHLRAERALLEQTLKAAVRVLVEILALIDPAEFGRSMRLRDQAASLARACGVQSTWEIEIAAMLARLGAVTVPAHVREKLAAGEPLDEGERRMLERVPDVGHRLLRRIPRLEVVAEIVRNQSARFDAPRSGEEAADVPFAARILAALAELLRLEDSGQTTSHALAALRSDPARWDPEVLRAMETWLSTRPESDPAHRARLTQVSLDALRPGWVLAEPIQTVDGLVLIAAGQEISMLALERIRNHARAATIREPISVIAMPLFFETSDEAAPATADAHAQPSS